MARLRDTKKAATAQAIVDATMELVRARRLADVSIDEIAGAAGVGRRTVFRYFPTKEDIVLDPRRIDRVWAAEALRSRRPGEDDVAVVLRVAVGIQQRAFAIFREEQQAQLHRLTHEEPEVTARSWLLLQDVRDLIVVGLVGNDPAPATLLRARTLVASCLIAMDAAITTWIEGGMRGDLYAVIEESGAYLRAGFGSKGSSTHGHGR